MITDVDQNHHASHNPEHWQSWNKSELNKLMARWSNAGPYVPALVRKLRCSRESSGDKVCQFAAAVCSLLHENFARGDKLVLPRLSDAKVLR